MLPPFLVTHVSVHRRISSVRAASLPLEFEASVQCFVHHQATRLCLDNVDKVFIFEVLLGRHNVSRVGFVSDAPPVSWSIR